MNLMTPERWLPVVGFEGFYEVSDFGRVRSLDRTVITSNSARRYRGKMLSSYVNVGTRGYPFVRLSSPQLRGNYAVHVLVLTAHVGPCPPGQETRHGPAGKLYAAVTNLSWGTRSKNAGMDRLRDGQDNRGERHGNHKLTAGQVLEMRRRRAEGESLEALAEEFGVSDRTISDICTGRSWCWLEGPRVTRKAWTKVSAEQVEEIRSRRAKKESLNSIAADYGISDSLVSAIALGHVRG